jgi:hypothetical protein
MSVSHHQWHTCVNNKSDREYASPLCSFWLLLYGGEGVKSKNAGNVQRTISVRTSSGTMCMVSINDESGLRFLSKSASVNQPLFLALPICANTRHGRP